MVLGICIIIRTGCQWFAKKLVIIQIIKHKNPLSDLSILQPVPEELENIRVAILTPGNLSTVGKVAQTFLAARSITRVNPENPGVRRFLSDLVAVFDDESRFTVAKLDLNRPLRTMFSPNPSYAKDNYSRSRDRGSFVDLSEEFIAADKVGIMLEWHRPQWFRARFWLV